MNFRKNYQAKAFYIFDIPSYAHNSYNTIYTTNYNYSYIVVGIALKDGVDVISISPFGGACKYIV